MYSFSGSQKTRFRKIQDLDSSTTSSAIEANEKKRQVFYDSKGFVFQEKMIVSKNKFFRV